MQLTHILSGFVGGLAYQSIRRFTDVHPWGGSSSQVGTVNQKDEAPEDKTSPGDEAIIAQDSGQSKDDPNP